MGSKDLRESVGKRELSWLAAITVLLLLFHITTIHRQSLFVDEFSEIHISQQPVAEILLRPDSMPPLYPLLLKGWLMVVDAGGYSSARWFSATIGLFSVIALWWAVRSTVGAKVALVSAALLAVNPFQLYYAQLVRGYALFTLVAVLAIGFFLRGLMQDSWRAWLGWAVMSVVGIFTHYYFAFVGITLLLILAVVRRGKLGANFLTMAALAVLIASPVILPLRADFGFQKELRQPRSASPAAVAYTYTSFFSGYSLGPSKSELQSLSARAAAQQMFPWVLALTATAGPLLILGIKRVGTLPTVGIFLALSTVPILLTAIAGWVAGLTYNPRFVAWCVAPLLVVIAAGICSPGNNVVRKLSTLGLLAIFAVALYGRHTDLRYQNEDLRGTAEYLATEVSDGEPVFAVSDYTGHLLNFYLRDRLTAIELPQPGEQSLAIDRDERLNQSLAEIDARAAGGRYWLVYCRSFHGDPAGMLLAELIRRDQLEETKRLAGVVIYRSQ